MVAHNIGKWRRVIPVLAAASLFVAVAFGLAMAPASADDNTVSEVETTQAVVTKGNPTDDNCTKDLCKRVPWCDTRTDSLAGTALALTEDAPTIALDKNGKGGEPRCVTKPTLKKPEVCCTNGKGDISIVVFNPNPFKLRIGVWADNGEIRWKWLGSDAAATYKFTGLGNGWHVIHAAVWVKDGKWCEFGKVKVKVYCPVPTPTATHTATPTATATTTPTRTATATVSTSAVVVVTTSTTNVSDELPVTGSRTTPFLLVGAALIVFGGVMLALSQRRRREDVRPVRIDD